MVLKLKFMWNSATLDITNNGLHTIIFGPEEVLRIIDLRSLGHYKIKQGILQQNLIKYYRFERADTLCEQFKKFINTPKKERQTEGSKEIYPWLDPSNERKYMTHRKILEKYIDLEKSCLTDKEKKEVMGMLYKYKEAFSLKDEIGTCPSLEIEINVMDKSPFLIRPLPCKRR